MGNLVAEHLRVNREQRNLESAIEQAVKKINAQTPIRVDEETTLVRSAGTNDTLIYNYHVNIDKNDLDIAKFNENMKEALAHDSCKIFADAFNLGGKVAYSYYDKNKYLINYFSISKDDCVSRQNSEHSVIGKSFSSIEKSSSGRRSGRR